MPDFLTEKMNGMINLRKIEPSDLPFLYQWENDATSWAEGDTHNPLSQQDLRDYIASTTGDIFRDGQLRLIIEKKPTANSHLRLYRPLRSGSTEPQSSFGHVHYAGTSTQRICSRGTPTNRTIRLQLFAPPPTIRRHRHFQHFLLQSLPKSRLHTLLSTDRMDHRIRRRHLDKTNTLMAFRAKKMQINLHN